MRLSELMQELEKTMEKYGDLAVCNWEGEVVKLEISLSHNGFFDEIEPNEIVLDFTTED